MLWALPALAQTDYLVVDVDDLFGLWYSESDWGDYDNDGDLDLLMAGYGPTSGQGYHKFYRNDGSSVFTLLDLGMTGTGNGSVGFADLDGDNDLDAFVCGQSSTGEDFTGIYINEAGSFVLSDAGIPDRVSSSVRFGDYDCDGDLDILLTGGTVDDTTSGYIHIFRNDGDFNFNQVDVGAPGIRYGNADFGDYNNDGWLDIALTGSAGTSNYISMILAGNSEGTFSEIPVTLPGLRYSRISWYDFDCDGDLDILLSGSSSNSEPSVFKLFRNDGNDVFTDVPQPNVTGERQGDVAWGDINNDGYPDLIVNGLITTTTVVEKLYLFNPQNSLYEDAQTLTYLKYAAVSLGDYDNDGKLDMSVSGHYSSGNYWNKLYQNINPAANTAPQAPSGLASVVAGNSVTLSWDPATDSETPSAGLSYNVRVGTSPGACDIISPLADTATGWRKVARPGNAWQRQDYFVWELADGTYYWSVQAIDNSFAGSGFAPEQTFTIGAVAVQDNIQPAISRLANHPNPFNPSTRISYTLAEPGRARISVYNARGQLVSNLFDEFQTSGDHSLLWNGIDINGAILPSGVYELRIQCAGQLRQHRMALIK
ncbi:MAG: FG-GAP-like repeat-containing protein [Candidatus Cloacimonetes bacterium]|nr:FG-GAP-like repeat-containing protein [Candidatus Cloacimonadota bacterium]